MGTRWEGRAALKSTYVLFKITHGVSNNRNGIRVDYVYIRLGIEPTFFGNTPDGMFILWNWKFSHWAVQKI